MRTNQSQPDEDPCRKLFTCRATESAATNTTSTYQRRSNHDFLLRMLNRTPFGRSQLAGCHSPAGCVRRAPCGPCPARYVVPFLQVSAGVYTVRPQECATKEHATIEQPRPVGVTSEQQSPLPLSRPATAQLATGSSTWVTYPRCTSLAAVLREPASTTMAKPPSAVGSTREGTTANTYAPPVAAVGRDSIRIVLGIVCRHSTAVALEGAGHSPRAAAVARGAETLRCRRGGRHKNPPTAEDIPDRSERCVPLVWGDVQSRQAKVAFRRDPGERYAPVSVCTGHSASDADVRCACRVSPAGLWGSTPAVPASVARNQVPAGASAEPVRGLYPLHTRTHNAEYRAPRCNGNP